MSLEVEKKKAGIIDSTNTIAQFKRIQDQTKEGEKNNGTAKGKLEGNRKREGESPIALLRLKKCMGNLFSDEHQG